MGIQSRGKGIGAGNGTGQERIRVRGFTDPHTGHVPKVISLELSLGPFWLRESHEGSVKPIL